MKFLIDASADSRDLRALLIEQGHDVVTAAEIGAGTPDDVLLARAAHEQRVLITKDKDFGELVFIYRMPHAGIVRLTDMSSQQGLEAVSELLDHHSDALGQSKIPVVSPNQVRVGRTEPEGRSDD